MALFIVIELLLIFDAKFSKFHLVGPLHLYDLIILLMAFVGFVSMLRAKTWHLSISLLLFSGISVVYLIYSLVIGNPTNYIVRQYALFVYPVLVYLIFFSYTRKENQQYNVRFLGLVGALAIIFQVGYLIFLGVTSDDLRLFAAHNYFSKMGVMAFVVFGAWVLVNVKKIQYRIPLFIAVLVLSLTIGHASAFIAVLGILFAFLLLRVKPGRKIIVSILVVVVLGFFYVKLPQFSDTNANWRLIYWKFTLRDMIVDYYGIFGHGFGVKLVTQDILNALATDLNSPWFEVRPEEQYTSPMHNSFITIAYHIGLVPSLLLLVPLKNAGYYFLNRYQFERDSSKDLLILAFIGVVIWSSFNVVLELPHSSALFWFIYFSILYEFKGFKKEVA